MMRFQTLFGIKESQVKNTCILMPLLGKDTLKGLGVEGFSRGRLYGSGNSPFFTVIHTGIGAVLLGDAVLYLEETPCQNIILFGSCGLVKQEKDLNIGSLVVPDKAYSLESFSGMLLKDAKDWKVFHGDSVLLESFLNENKTHNIKKVACLTLSSLKLEEDYLDLFREKQIQALDMECSALFSASRHIGRKGMALFYVTDIIDKKPFYRALTREDKSVLSSSIKSATNILCEFIKKNLNS